MLQLLKGQKHVCEILDIFHTNNSICIVTDYYEKTLSQLLHPKQKQLREREEESDEEEEKENPPTLLPLDKVKSFIQQILTGLAEMHEKNVWHRDVTPGNILLAPDETLKFIDFGISKLAELDLQQKHTKNVVTRNYRAPEIFFGDNKYNGEALDIWSAGCIFAELLTNQVIFPGSSDIDQLCKIFDVCGTPSE